MGVCILLNCRDISTVSVRFPGVKERMVETVVPRTERAAIMVVGGKRKRQVSHYT